VADLRVGKITHYYDKLGVAVVELIGDLGVGDKIKVVSGENEFTQDVESMQAEHEQVKSAKKGESVGLKVNEPAKKGAEVFKTE